MTDTLVTAKCGCLYTAVQLCPLHAAAPLLEALGSILRIAEEQDADADMRTIACLAEQAIARAEGRQ